MESTAKRGFLSTSMTNPVLKKMERSVETAPADAKAATYGGIGLKTAFFILVTIVGVGLYFWLHSYLLSQTGEIMAPVHVKESIFEIDSNIAELLILFVAAIITIFAPLLSWIFKLFVPFNGTLYALAQGYSIAFLTGCLSAEYRWLAVLAMILTIAIVSMMLFVYAKRIVKVTHRFRQIITVTFLTAAFGGVILFVLRFIPGVNKIVAGLDGIMANPVVSIISSVIFIIIAALFLLADFDTIERCVEERMPKKLEWMAAFGLVYTIIYLYFKILHLLITIFSNSSD